MVNSLPIKALFLASTLGSIGGMQRRDRLLIKAMDAFFYQHYGQLLPFSLIDSSERGLHGNLQQLRVTPAEILSEILKV